MQMVATDILGPLPESLSGNSYILVAADYFTRWVEAYPIPCQEAAVVARKLVVTLKASLGEAYTRVRERTTQQLE